MWWDNALAIAQNGQRSGPSMGGLRGSGQKVGLGLNPPEVGAADDQDPGLIRLLLAKALGMGGGVPAGNPIDDAASAIMSGRRPIPSLPPPQPGGHEDVVSALLGMGGPLATPLDMRGGQGPLIGQLLRLIGNRPQMRLPPPGTDVMRGLER